jgi:hypothetical protein
MISCCIFDLHYPFSTFLYCIGRALQKGQDGRSRFLVRRYQRLLSKSLVMPAPSISNDGSKVRVEYCGVQLNTSLAFFALAPGLAGPLPVAAHRGKRFHAR